MTRFKRLTDAEARTLTRRELLDRIEAEQKYWIRKRRAADREAWREFGRIMHAYVDPAAGLQAVRDLLEGRRNDYWESRPCPGGAVRRRRHPDRPGDRVLRHRRRAGRPGAVLPDH